MCIDYPIIVVDAQVVRLTVAKNVDCGKSAAKSSPNDYDRALF